MRSSVGVPFEWTQGAYPDSLLASPSYTQASKDHIMTDPKVAPDSPSKVKAEAPADSSTKRKAEETDAAAANPAKVIKTDNATTTPVKAEGNGATTNGDAAAVKKEPTEADIAKIRDLVDFYFGDANFRRDKFMKTEAEKSPEGKPDDDWRR